MLTATNQYTQEYRGKSTDTKPVLEARNNGSQFIEFDTGKLYFFDGATLTWVEFVRSDT